MNCDITYIIIVAIILWHNAIRRYKLLDYIKRLEENNDELKKENKHLNERYNWRNND